MKLQQRHSSDWGLTLVILLLQALLLTSCVGGVLYGTGSLEKAESMRHGEPPSPPLPVLPPQLVYQGRTLTMDALALMAPQYDYIIMDRGGRAQYLPLQAETARAILGAPGWNDGANKAAKALATMPPALAVEGVSLELNPENDPNATAADAGATSATSSSPRDAVRAMLPDLLSVFQEKMGHGVEVRGLSLPNEALAQIRNGGVKAVSASYRKYLPPVVLPMKEEALTEARESSSLVPARGSSETAVLASPSPGASTMENLQNSAMAWNAVNIAHDGVNRPLFVALDRAWFDRGRGLGEALRYFDAPSRVLQLIIVPAHPERITGADGNREIRLVADTPITSLAPAKPGAEYVYMLVQPEYIP